MASTATKGPGAYTGPASDDDEALDYGDSSGFEPEVLNLTDVDEKAVFAPLPIGVYTATVENVEYTRSSKGNRMLVWSFVVTDPTSNQKRKLFYYIVDSGDRQQYLARLKRTILRVDPGFDISSIDLGRLGRDLAGSLCQIRVGQQTYKGDMRNNVKDVLPAEEEGANFLDDDDD
jgi:hypothetical protein